MAMKRVYVVKLSEQERAELIQYLRRGRSSARSQTRARILLLSDDDLEDDEIVEALKVSKSTVCRIRKRYWFFAVLSGYGVRFNNLIS